MSDLGGSPVETAIFDASPLIYLDALSYAELLPKVHCVIVPPAVAGELAARPDEPGGRLPERP